MEDVSAIKYGGLRLPEAERDQLAASLHEWEESKVLVESRVDQLEASLETARKALENVIALFKDRHKELTFFHAMVGMFSAAKDALAQLSKPAATLEERDREVARRTAERCAEIADSEKSAEIRREFGLEEA